MHTKYLAKNIAQLAATPLRRGITVASRLWLCIFNCDSAYLSDGLYHSIRDCGCAYLAKCDSAYLIKWSNSHFATVTLHITPSPSLSFAANGAKLIGPQVPQASRWVSSPFLMNRLRGMILYNFSLATLCQSGTQIYGSFHANVNLKNGKKWSKIILQQIIVSLLCLVCFQCTFC